MSAAVMQQQATPLAGAHSKRPPPSPHASADDDASERSSNIWKPTPKKPRLPLKKRLVVQTAASDAPAAVVPSEPVDFSLPHRVRAKASPSKHSDTDSERSADSSGESQKLLSPSAAALDLSKPVRPTARSAFHSQLTSAFAPLAAAASLPPSSLTLAAAQHQFLQNPLSSIFWPFVGLPPTAFGAPAGLLPGSAASQLLSVASTSKNAAAALLPAQKSPRSDDGLAAPPGSFVINPATGNKVRRNYKNMTRERRAEANARERTRVHTIGAAFEQLRVLVPSLAADQKLSKLSILRIACKYILLLAAMNELDYSESQHKYSVNECVEMLNDTILAESKSKKP